MLFRSSLSAAAGATSDPVYVWVYEAGVTQGSGQGKGLTVELGVGADGTTPDGSWSWTAMAWNMDKDGLSSGDLANDEYAGTLTAPATVGSYDFAARVSADGGASWLSCDLGGDTCGGAGSDDGYSAATAGSLTVQ